MLTLHQIIATALPTIATKFNATPSEYSWVATAYQLAMTLLTPINGRVSDIIGRKPLLYAAIIIFTIFSAVCGCAKSMTWLITARAFQGLGGGSIIGLTNIVVSDIVPLEKRGQYQGFMGGAWGVASVLGPILGGLLTQKASWRWCFVSHKNGSFMTLLTASAVDQPPDVRSRVCAARHDAKAQPPARWHLR